MGQKLLQITECVASSQTEEGGHLEDPGFFFIERIWVLRSNLRMPYSTESFIRARQFDTQHVSHDSVIRFNS
jgi:hypothetical protein